MCSSCNFYSIQGKKRALQLVGYSGRVEVLAADLDCALLQHDETVVRPARHQEQERLCPARPEPEGDVGAALGVLQGQREET